MTVNEMDFSFTDSVYYLLNFFLVLHSGAYDRAAVVGGDVRDRVHLHARLREDTRDSDRGAGDALAQV